MNISILLALLIIVILGVLTLSVLLLKRRIKIISTPFFLTFILSIAIPGLIIAYHLAVFSCLGGCKVTKYTPFWFATMNQSTIGNLPIIDSIDDVEYYFDGELGETWQVTYKSHSQLSEIQREIENYLIKKKAHVNAKTSCYNGYWKIHDKTVIVRYKTKDTCIMIYLDDNDSHVLVRALEMN